MRIALNMLFVSPVLAGGRVYCEGLLSGFAAIDQANDYTIFTRAETDLPTLPLQRFHQLRAPVPDRSTLWRTFWEYGRLPREVRRGGYALLHGLGSLSPTPRTCPTVLTIHDLIYHHHPETVPRGHRWFMHAVLPVVARRAARIIVPSRSTANDVVLHLGVDERRIRLIPYGRGQDFRRITDRETIDQCLDKLGVRRPYIISVCRGYPHKNLAGLLRAFAALRSSGLGDVQLVLVGDRVQSGPVLDQLAQALHLMDQVLFTGFVDQSTLNALYSAATVFAFPSLAEGLGLPVMEAMACGAPVVASDASAVPEAVGAAGCLANARDPEAFAAALRQVLSDAALQAELRRRGLERAQEFSWERCASATLQVYDEL